MYKREVAGKNHVDTISFDRIRIKSENMKQNEQEFEKTSETMDKFCFVISATGLNRPNTGKHDEGYDIF
jgi:hypothetical protein